MLYICRAKLRQVGTQCPTFSKHEKLCGDSYVTHDKKRTLLYILLQRCGARCGHARRAGRVCGGHVGARGRRDMCASVASFQLFLLITDSAQRARSWRRDNPEMDSARALRGPRTRLAAMVQPDSMPRVGRPMPLWVQMAPNSWMTRRRQQQRRLRNATKRFFFSKKK